MSLVVKSRSQVRGPHKPSQWIVWDGGFMGGRHLTVNEAVRHEWGEAAWTARILAQGEAAGRALGAIPRLGCFG